MNWVDFCNGFMQAASDVAVLNNTACVPPGTTRTKLAETFELYATQLFLAQPELGKEAGLSIASSIISVAYPCE
jgi:hypothetical protein